MLMEYTIIARYKIVVNMITELIIHTHIVSVTVDVPKTSIIMGKIHYKGHCINFFIFDDRSGTSVIPYVNAVKVIVKQKFNRSH
jgi:hypothetical protein